MIGNLRVESNSIPFSNVAETSGLLAKISACERLDATGRDGETGGLRHLSIFASTVVLTERKKKFLVLGHSENPVSFHEKIFGLPRDQDHGSLESRGGIRIR